MKWIDMLFVIRRDTLSYRRLIVIAHTMKSQNMNIFNHHLIGRSTIA